jgi:hypothetical protein
LELKRTLEKGNVQGNKNLYEEDLYSCGRYLTPLRNLQGSLHTTAQFVGVQDETKFDFSCPVL